MHLMEKINIHTHHPLDFCTNSHNFFGDIRIFNWLIVQNTWTNVLESRSRSRVERLQWSHSIENINIHKSVKMFFFASSRGSRVKVDNLDIDLQSCSRWNLNMEIDSSYMTLYLMAIGMCRNMSQFSRYSRLNLANMQKFKQLWLNRS